MSSPAEWKALSNTLAGLACTFACQDHSPTIWRHRPRSAAPAWWPSCSIAVSNLAYLSCLPGHRHRQAAEAEDGCSPEAEEALERRDIPALQRADPEHWESALATRGWGPQPLRDWLLDLALDAEVSRQCARHVLKPRVPICCRAVILHWLVRACHKSPRHELEAPYKASRRRNSCPLCRLWTFLTEDGS